MSPYESGDASNVDRLSEKEVKYPSPLQKADPLPIDIIYGELRPWGRLDPACAAKLAAHRNVERYMNLVAWGDHEGTYEVTLPDVPTRHLAVASQLLVAPRSMPPARDATACEHLTMCCESSEAM